VLEAQKLILRFFFKNKEIRLSPFLENTIKGVKIGAEIEQDFFYKNQISQKLLMLKI